MSSKLKTARSHLIVKEPHRPTSSSPLKSRDAPKK